MAIINEIFCIFSAIIVLWLGLKAFFKNRHNQLNLIWFINSLVLSFWFLVMGCRLLSGGFKCFGLLGRFSVLALVLLPAFFNIFTLTLFNIQEKKYFRLWRFSLFLVVFLFFCLLTPFFLSSFKTIPEEIWPGLWILAVFFSGVILYSEYLLKRFSQVSKGVKNLKGRYLALGGAILLVSGLLSLLPNPTCWVAGVYLMVMYPFLISFFILGGQPVQSKVFLKKFLVFVAGVVFVFLLYHLENNLAWKYFKNEPWVFSYWLPLIYAIIIILFYRKLEKLLQRILDRFFFREKYNYRQILLEASAMMATILDLNHLLELIVRITMRVMRITGAAILYFDEKAKLYRVRNSRGQLKGAQGQAFGGDNALIEYLALKKQPVVYEFVQERILEVTGREPDKEIFYKRIRAQMDRLGAALVIPGIFTNRLIGAFCMGEKKSGEPYTQEDLELLITLANQAAIAVENAKAFQKNLSMKNFTELILGQMPQGAIVTDLEGNILVFNQGAQQISGYYPEQALGRPLRILFYDYPDFWDLVPKTIRDKKVLIDDLKFKPQFRREEEKILTISSYFYEGTLEEDKEVIIFIFDKTELRQAREKIAQQQKLAEVGLMAGGIAHDIKNPLTSVSAATQLLSKDFSNKANQQAFLEIVPKELERLKNILNSLNSYSSEVMLKLKDTDLNELLANRLRLVEAVCLKNHIEVVSDFGRIPVIKADAEVLERVFQNVIFNAVQAMDKITDRPKILKISTRVRKEFFLEVEEDSVVVEISDTGSGMDEVTVFNLFKPFFTTKSPGEGTGLGLALVEKYIKAHGGLVSVESRVGEGTTFIIKLPLSPKNDQLQE